MMRERVRATKSKRKRDLLFDLLFVFYRTRIVSGSAYISGLSVIRDRIALGKLRW
jgi:hypothetical protein